MSDILDVVTADTKLDELAVGVLAEFVHGSPILPPAAVLPKEAKANRSQSADEVVVRAEVPPIYRDLCHFCSPFACCEDGRSVIPIGLALLGAPTV